MNIFRNREGMHELEMLMHHADPCSDGLDRRCKGFGISVDDNLTGIGLVTAIGHSREAVWQAIQRSDCGVGRLAGVPGIPDGLMLGATVDVDGASDGAFSKLSSTLAEAGPAIAVRCSAAIECFASDASRSS